MIPVHAILASIRTSLEDDIVPRLAEDRLASSVLRSIDGLLAHSEARLKGEQDFLSADIADLREVLDLPPGSPALQTGTDLAAENRRLREQVDELLAAAIADHAEETVARIDGYIARRRQREIPFFEECFINGTY